MVILVLKFILDVCQKSTLHMVLPNSVSEYSYIVVAKYQSDSRGGNQRHSGLKSTKFTRAVIQRFLGLLLQAIGGVWKSNNNEYIQLSQNNLRQWHEKGDIATMNQNPHVLERDKDCNILSMDYIGPSTGEIPLHTGGNDSGRVHVTHPIAPEGL